MVDLSRRKTMLGMGMLAAGSGAAFTSAAFQDQFDAGADFRVIVDQRLIVRAGEAFRDGDGSYDPTDDSAEDWATEYSDQSPIFNNADDVAPGQLPTVAVNDEEDGSLEIEVATAVGDTDDFSDLLEVVNTDLSADVGITFVEYGEDATDASGGAISRSTIRNIYQFEMGESTRISQTGDDTDDASGFSFSDSPDASPFTVGSGETEQIKLTVDTSDDESDIVAAADTSGDRFGEAFDDVDLVDTIRIGIVDDSE